MSHCCLMQYWTRCCVKETCANGSLDRYVLLSSIEAQRFIIFVKVVALLSCSSTYDAWPPLFNHSRPRTISNILNLEHLSQRQKPSTLTSHGRTTFINVTRALSFVVKLLASNLPPPEAQCRNHICKILHSPDFLGR
jgi:hypothetical protein